MSTRIAPLNIESKIFSVRDQRAILDADLADVYGVTTKALNQAIKRKEDRFPADFRFRLTGEEVDALRSQDLTSKPGRGGRRYALGVY